MLTREEVDAVLVARGDRVESVLARDAVAAAREPERDRERLVEEVADADRARRPRSRRPACAPGPRGTGCASSRSRPGRRSRRPRWSRARSGAANSASGEAPRASLTPRMPPSSLPIRLSSGDHDQDDEGDPDEQRVAACSAGPPRWPAARRAAGLARRALGPPAARRRRQAGVRESGAAGRGATADAERRNPSSAQTSAAGRTSITPAARRSGRRP